jgi:hypothetical protein
MEDQITIYDSVDIEHQGDALDFMCKKWQKDDVISIIWTKTDDDGFHHFEIVLRTAKKSKSD